MNYQSNKGPRYDRAVTRKILRRSIAKNRAKRDALVVQKSLNEAKWEAILSGLIHISNEDERQKIATNQFCAWLDVSKKK